LNPSWLQEEKFNEIVKEVWKDPIYHTEPDPTSPGLEIKNTKMLHQTMGTPKQTNNLTRLKELEHNIQTLLLEDNSDGGHRDKILTLQLLETERNKILLADEA
jgi:hypothetical protein